MNTQSNPRRYGKSTLVTNAFLAEAEAGKSVRFESPNYVCLSRKAFSDLLKSEEKRVRRQMVERIENHRKRLLGTFNPERAFLEGYNRALEDIIKEIENE